MNATELSAGGKIGSDSRESGVTMLVNIGLGVVPSAWRTAVTTPVPKCTPVGRVNDLQPISITSILSRLVERLIVRDHIYPAIPSNDIIDQYDFKSPGSTTAALVDLTNRISVTLEENKYVRCLLLISQRRSIRFTNSL